LGLIDTSGHSRHSSRTSRRLALGRVIGTSMISSLLQGRSILIVEDEPLIVLDMTRILQNHGIHVTSTNTLKHAMLLVEHDGLDMAILDHALGRDDNSCALYARLATRSIPFLIYSGYSRIDGAPIDTPFLQKPATEEDFIAAIERTVTSPAPTPKQGS
jgi:DNA-binding NtrC family response regulator